MYSATNDDSRDLPELNPLFPPEGGRCIVNELPSELLSHTFTLECAWERGQHPDEDDVEDVDEGESDDGTISTSSSLSGDDRSSTRSELDNEDRRARKQPFNMLVSHVCGRWRAVALDSSLLWTPIYFEGPPPWERAVIYLDRAGKVPLSISIDRTVEEDDDGSEGDYDSEDEDEPKDNDPDFAIITEIMDTVVSHIDHIQALEIMVLQLYHYEDTDDPFLAGLDLELAYHARDVRLSFKNFTRTLRASPDLRTLTLSLSLSGPGGVPGERASVNFSTDDDEDDGSAMFIHSSAPLVLSRLQNLVLAYLEPPYLLALLPRLSLPTLTELVLVLEDEDFADLLSYLASLPCAESAVLDAYKQLDKLVAFNLNVDDLGGHWFDLLVPSPAPSTSATTNQNELYLPRLEVLTMTGVDGVRLREVVEARAARGAPLWEVRVNDNDDVEEEDEAWLRRHLGRFDTFKGSDEEEVDVVDDFDDEDDFDGGPIVFLPF
ncbi:hypothetical protein LXA43DRAFT_974226 [Ganoderma leucocontextum]|nr:hypothetical protein LXA43DRAFT_974226 [Ganoderma leucocontextum]